jgi:nucleoside-diphosphate-sugar epimerase
VIADYAGVRVAVLGASGFIGRWVARKLAEAGAETALVVRDRTTVSDLRGKIFEVDLARNNGVEPVFEAFRPAIIFNLAGYGVDQAERDEALSERLNADLPREICGAAAIWKDPSWLGQHIVHVGSALEYGVAGGDLREDGPTQPTTLYGRSKLCGTQQVIESCRKPGMRGLTARLFTVYGPGEHDTRLLPSLIRASKSGQRLDLTGGAQLRDFTYVEDVAEGLLRLGVSRAEPGLVVNLATGCLSSVRSFVEIAARVLGIPGSKLGFGALPTRAEEMRHGPVSVLRLREMTGFVPSTPIETGVGKTMAWANRHPGTDHI